jgi:hypothetical protein
MGWKSWTLLNVGVCGRRISRFICFLESCFGIKLRRVKGNIEHVGEHGDGVYMEQLGFFSVIFRDRHEVRSGNFISRANHPINGGIMGSNYSWEILFVYRRIVWDRVILKSSLIPV